MNNAHHHHHHHLHHHHHHFCTIAFDAYGRIGEQTDGQLRCRSALGRGLSASAELERWRELLGVCLQLEHDALLADG